ncbi:nipped-B-like protein [Pseudonaja textilis]|uniref:nipped-B-like protein n=1 Tax=Pseudonaja textilis TaxID=8673 RepID=UPI000EA862A1|nr:nipped-B-like protein [Pseudonaja textilis]
MNGDMPHVPITTLAGIASLTDLLNQLPLPSPLPATTTKSLLFNGRIAEEVNCLLACRDENLVSQLVHSLNQVSTDHIELKDNLGSDDPEGDIPVLLQAVLARNPNVFREKSMQNRYGVQSGMMMPQYKLSQNSMHGSPASSNYQQTTISHSPSSRFVPPQSSSGNRFMAPQNSPVPSPYAPQSPAGYLPYSHPPSYTPHPQIQQASVSSPIVSGGMRNIHENKITSQLGSSTNHHPDNTRHGSSEDYLHMVHRISSEDGDSSIRNTASFSLRSPQSVCSPAGSDGTPKGSRPPLILPSQPPPYSSPRDVPPDILLDSPERKQKKQKKMKLVKDEKDQTEKAAMYDIISSPSKDSTKLTLRLSRIRSSDMDQQDDMLSGLENSNASEGDISFNVQYPGQTSKTPVTPQDINRPLNAAQCLPQHEQTAFLQAQQVPVLQPNTSVSAKQPQNPLVQTHPQVSQHGTITPYDEVELDALAEIERIERESAIERERFSKEVQDKDKPLKKRKQDSFPQEAGGATGGNKPASQDTNSAGNGSRPALMVSIDLQQAGRADSQAVLTQDLDIIKKPEEIKQCNDGSLFVAQDDVIGVLKLKTENFPETLRKKSDSEGIKMEVQHNENKQTGIQQNEGKRIEIKHCESKQAEIKHESKHENRQVDVKQNEGKQNNGKQEIRQRPETPKQKNEVRPDTPKQKNEGRPETPKQKNEGRPETPKHRHENRRDSNKSSLEKKLDISKYKMDMKSDPSRVKSERSDSLKQRPDGRSISDSVRRDHDGLKQKTEDRGESERYRGDPSKMRRPEYLRSSSKGEHDSKHIIRTDNTKAERLDRKHRHESGESRDKLSSGDQRSRPDSPRIKQESKLRTDRPSFKSQNSKDDRRTDGNKSKMDSSKAHGDSKAEFPSYLLGGRSGALKHFIIPKIKRDKDGNVMHEVRKSEFKGEPKNKVEKIGLVEDLNKGAKPVVVLQKLSLDDVQKFIKDREDKSRSTCFRSNKNKSSKSSKGSIDQSVLKELPPELLAEIESTMPLCERVKMNKRKRSTVNEKPKYAEISSDEDNDSEEAFETSRKRHRKDRNDDKAWEYEEHDRRSGDHKRSAHYHEGRRSSGSSRYRARSPEDSDMDDYSPPPSLSEVARKMKKKEKQKKRKAYEPKLTPEEMMDSSTFKRFSASVENILDNLEDMDFTAFGDDDEIPQELLLGKHQLSELGSESAKIKAMGIMDRLSTEKTVKVLNILEKNIQDGAKLSTLLNHPILIFLIRCGSKQGEEDYRPLFENFVQDLLSTVNKPEWPAAELLLSLLGRLLVHQFSNKSTEMALRVASLDYLGTVAARLRKDAVTSKMDQGSIARILKQVSGGEDEIQQLQKALLDYLEENTETDASLVFSRKFYIAQWFRDTTMETEKAMKSQKDEDSSEGTHHSKEVETTGQIMHRAESRKKFLRNIIKTAPSQFSTLKINSDTVDYEDACLVVRYLASMRPFAQSFDIYLTQILRVLGENAIAVRTKAMKCLSEVVAVDPSILARLDMQRGVHGRLMDNSTSVREAAVELLGRFVLCRPQLAEQYYDMLIERILDTGISVRKRVIKILRDICIEQPTFPKITEMCVKMIRRVNDEEGIKKLVNETFQKLWFTPTPHNDKEAMTRKILNITDVVAACRDTGYDWFEQLLQNLLKSEEDASYKPVKKACTQLVDNLVEHILKYEESLADSDNKGVNSSRLVACITTLFLFSKIRPQLMVKHAMTMQPYLTTKCSNQNDFMVICNVAKILELVVPLMEHPSETFLATMEEDLMKLIIKYGMTVVQHCVSCLGAVVNKVTQNFKFVWACFNRYYGALSKLKSQHQEDPNSTILTANKPALLRSLFTVGALCRHFDFDQEDFKGNSKVNIKDKVLELLMYFTKHSDEEVQTKAIIGLGFAFIQHPSLMFEQEVKTLYNNILSDKNCSVNLKIQVLKNLQTYLQEEDTRMQQADREWKKVAKQEDLKEMGDISSGMSSSIMQLYLKQVLEAFFHTQSSVRHFALNVIALTLNQGLIHPVQCVPYLIAMGTDPEPSMRNKADQQLVEIDKKYAGFIHMKAVAGMKMSYQVQQAINTCRKDPVRGFRQDESSSALCSHLYSMIRGNRQHRRAFLISLLNLFDDTAKTEVNMLLYIADNLACFPYQTQEEPLFIMHHIDITLSVSGSNLLQSFKESMVKYKKEKKPSSDEESESESNSESDSESEEEIHKSRKSRKRADSDSDTDEENDINAVMKCLPDNSAPLIEFANVSQGILLLLMLKQHLKNLCGFSDTKIQKYSPSESAKVYDKAINRKAGIHFHPKQTLDFLRSDMANSRLTEDVKRNIVKQYLDFKLLMEHLDPDEEEEDGEVSASTNARNKAITSLLGGGSPRNNAAETEEDESDGEDRGGGTSGSLRRSKRNSDSTELAAQMNESVDVMDVIAICCPKYKDRPQIARVVQKTSNGFSVQWMAGSYSGSWTEAKRRDGRKLVPWVDTIKESDIIYKKIALTSANKLTNKVVQTLRSLYAAKDGTSS